MKYRIESPEDGITYEAERTWEEFEAHSLKVAAKETQEIWVPIDWWSKQYPIL